MIIDSTDPVGPAEGLFMEDFYRAIKGVLSESGIVVTQSGSPFYQPETWDLGTKRPLRNPWISGK